jgi:hypothetical protein
MPEPNFDNSVGVWEVPDVTFFMEGMSRLE